MSILADAFRASPRASAPDAMSDFWYTSDPGGYMVERSISGLGLSADTIMKCSTVYGAVSFRGDSWAMCPPSTYEKTATGRKEVPDHYSQIVLRRPNKTQTGNRWRNLNGVWMATWGNAYDEIVAGPRSFAQELRPMHPSRVRIVDQRADGALVYAYREQAGPERTLGQEKVLHFRDISTDGISGLPMYQLIRNVVGIALLAEKHASTFLAKGTRISGLLIPNKPTTPEQRKELKDSVNMDVGGPNATGTFGILPSGVELKEITRTHRESQFIELSDLIVGSILRFLRVPGVLVGYSKDRMGYASAEAFFEKGGIKHCVLPILTNVEAECEKALLPDDSGLQIKFNLDALLRANIKDRYDAYGKALGSAPFLTVNEVRTQEDFDELPDPIHNEVRIPANLLPPAPEPEPPPFAPFPPKADPPPDPPADDEEGPDASRVEARARAHAETLARQVVRREQAAIHGSNGGQGAARRFAKDADGWVKWVDGYYEQHASHVARVLSITDVEAGAYAEGQRIALLSEGPAVTEKWEAENVPRLVALALGEGA